jgi:hypothetical protein
VVAVLARELAIAQRRVRRLPSTNPAAAVSAGIFAAGSSGARFEENPGRDGHAPGAESDMLLHRWQY